MWDYTSDITRLTDCIPLYKISNKDAFTIKKEKEKNKMKYKLKDFVTEDMLKDVGFNVMSKTNNVNGCYPLIWRARRGHLCVYIGIDKKEKIT